jgi:hypothetical protein
MNRYYPADTVTDGYRSYVEAVSRATGVKLDPCGSVASVVAAIYRDDTKPAAASETSIPIRDEGIEFMPDFDELLDMGIFAEAPRKTTPYVPAVPVYSAEAVGASVGCYPGVFMPIEEFDEPLVMPVCCVPGTVAVETECDIYQVGDGLIAVAVDPVLVRDGVIIADSTRQPCSVILDDRVDCCGYLFHAGMRCVAPLAIRFGRAVDRRIERLTPTGCFRKWFDQHVGADPPPSGSTLHPRTAQGRLIAAACLHTDGAFSDFATFARILAALFPLSLSVLSAVYLRLERVGAGFAVDWRIRSSFGRVDDDTYRALRDRVYLDPNPDPAALFCDAYGKLLHHAAVVNDAGRRLVVWSALETYSRYKVFTGSFNKRGYSDLLMIGAAKSAWVDGVRLASESFEDLVQRQPADEDIWLHAISVFGDNAAWIRAFWAPTGAFRAVAKKGRWYALRDVELINEALPPIGMSTAGDRAYAVFWLCANLRIEPLLDQTCLCLVRNTTEDRWGFAASQLVRSARLYNKSSLTSVPGYAIPKDDPLWIVVTPGRFYYFLSLDHEMRVIYRNYARAKIRGDDHNAKRLKAALCDCASRWE